MAKSAEDWGITIGVILVPLVIIAAVAWKTGLLDDYLWPGYRTCEDLIPKVMQMTVEQEIAGSPPVLDITDIEEEVNEQLVRMESLPGKVIDCWGLAVTSSGSVRVNFYLQRGVAGEVFIHLDYYAG